ncbi:molybdenum cofactor guanylyltransferase MobA [Spiribacter roseus]|uniref:molybdenum cofactor guanylyltransferase MobA n=1 Tax=Spiribacter roseus TaxID=1855875 RepID=UPI0013307198|nr:molybdenum cofactor guanylyltransferase MobA [Spiribacter roseus]KAF0284197.1 hypothetical protein BA898_07540 [Spiribacter roseus]
MTLPVTAVILAGGRATRMGGRDKGLIPLAGRPMIAWVIEAVAPWVSAVIINANRNVEAYRSFGYPVIGDDDTGTAGPLAGLAAGLAACRNPWLLTVPCDTPAIPAALPRRLAAEVDGHSAAIAHDGQRLQPAHGLLSAGVADPLTGFMAQGDRRLHAWYATLDTRIVDFSDHRDAFDNVNTPEQHAAMAARLSGRQQEDQ